MTCLRGHRLSISLTLPYSPLLFGCSGVVSFIINHKSQYSIFLRSMSNSSKLWNLVEGVGTPNFVDKSERSVGNLGTQYFQLVSEVRDLLWD